MNTETIYRSAVSLLLAAAMASPTALMAEATEGVDSTSDGASRALNGPCAVSAEGGGGQRSRGRSAALVDICRVLEALSPVTGGWSPLPPVEIFVIETGAGALGAAGEGGLGEGDGG